MKVVVCLPIAAARLVVLVGLRWRLGRENEIFEEREGKVRERELKIFFFFSKLMWHLFTLTKICNIILEVTYAYRLPYKRFC